MWFGEGLSALSVVTHQMGEISALSNCFLREVFFCFILTSVLPFLANVTDLPPLTGSEGFPFWPTTPPFFPRLWPEKSDLTAGRKVLLIAMIYWVLSLCQVGYMESTPQKACGGLYRAHSTDERTESGKMGTTLR